jgi:hypothetical protein
MIDEQWQTFGREVEAHLTRIDDELGALRETLRRAGINVRRQRVRVTPLNNKARDALTVLRQEAQQGPAASLSPAGVGRRIGVSAEYAYDLLMALVASGAAERIARGRYRAAPGEAASGQGG